MKIVNLFYIFLGFIALALGAAGIVLPLLPTTPLLLAACFCFAKGSSRFHHWLVNTWFYKKYLSGFAKTKAMTLKTKLSICITASILVSIPFILSPFWIVRVIILCVIAFKWYYFMFRIKTIKRKVEMYEKNKTFK